ncbi:MAG: GNAT family N-acetyltransferase [Streptosporangiales bacterium]|nr:GNAT family N-acetyltransferase [Streptosporangiales bacterium]
MLDPDYPLRTERLLLRPFIADDLDALYDIHSRPEVARFLYWEPRSREEALEALTLKIGQTAIREEGDRLALAVTPQAGGPMLGEVMVSLASADHRQGEIGYIFHPDHGGKGYATEAAREMMRLGFDALGLHRLYGRLEARNIASARVLERLGMRREAHLRQNEFVKGEWNDELVYAMLETEWRAAPADR